MNQLENSIQDENNEKYIIYHSKKIKINEIKIGENEFTKKEIYNEKKTSNNLEELNAIDESFFEKLTEMKDTEKAEDEENDKNDSSNKRLIEEFLKKKEDKKFLEELGNLGFVIKNNNDESEGKEKKVRCPICYEDIDYTNNKIEVGKCSHQICQKCWKRLEDSKGNAKCPTCRKNVKKAERNIVYID